MILRTPSGYELSPSSERRSEDKIGKSPDRNSDKKTDDKRPVKKEKQFDLPTVTQTHELADDDRECDDCGGQLVSWDEQFEEFEEVDVIEREYRIVTHRRQKYRCACGCAPVTCNCAWSGAVAR